MPKRKRSASKSGDGLRALILRVNKSSDWIAQLAEEMPDLRRLVGHEGLPCKHCGDLGPKTRTRRAPAIGDVILSVMTEPSAYRGLNGPETRRSIFDLVKAVLPEVQYVSVREGIRVLLAKKRLRTYGRCLYADVDAKRTVSRRPCLLERRVFLTMGGA